MKNLKRIIVILLLLLAASAYALLSQPSGIPVLNYHQINDKDENALTVSSSQFAAQMDYLKNEGYHTITADELADALEKGAKLPEKPVLISFDDGYLDNYTVAYPILKERDMHAIIFLISDYVGLYPNYLTWPQILEMQENNIEFGSHTLSHSVLTELGSDAEIEHQLKNSRLAIEWHLARPVKYLAYPCGYITDSIESITKSTGYRGAFTVDLGNTHPGDNMYELHRVPIFGGNTHTLMRFKARLRAPRFAAFLEKCQKTLYKNGFKTLAYMFPTI